MVDSVPVNEGAVAVHVMFGTVRTRSNWGKVTDVGVLATKLPEVQDNVRFLPLSEADRVGNVHCAALPATTLPSAFIRSIQMPVDVALTVGAETVPRGV